MKAAFLLLSGGILFTGVFLGGMVAGGAVVLYTMEHDQEYQAKRKAENYPKPKVDYSWGYKSEETAE